MSAPFTPEKLERQYASVAANVEMHMDQAIQATPAIDLTTVPDTPMGPTPPPTPAPHQARVLVVKVVGTNGSRKDKNLTQTQRRFTINQLQDMDAFLDALHIMVCECATGDYENVRVFVDWAFVIDE